MTKLPTGYARATPYLLYADAKRATQFLSDAFGFEELPAERTTDGDGQLVHTAMRIIDQTIQGSVTKPSAASHEKIGNAQHNVTYYRRNVRTQRVPWPPVQRVHS